MPSNRILSRIALAALAIAPVASVATFFRDTAAKHPLLLITLLVVWEALLFIGRFFGKVYGRLQERWVDRAADWSDATLRRVFSRYPREYKYFLSRIHHDVDLRGLSTWGMYTLAMNDVFVDLSLMPQSPHLIPSGPVAQPNGEVDQSRKVEVPTEVLNDSSAGTAPVAATRRSIWQTLDQYPNGPIAVLGPPGSGKTTLLRHVTLMLCGHHGHQQVPRRWRRHIPLLIFLREHVAAIIADPSITLADVLRRTLSRLTKTEPPGWLDRQLDDGNCIVMLDGLDEVARREDRANVMRWVRDQIAQYPRNRFILTSRPFGFMDPPLISATVVQVRQFTDAQVEIFVRNWYRAVEQRSANRDDIGVRARAEEGADKLLDRLYESPSLLALATNPLLLTMIASVHKYRAALPGSRAELYREICQVFLGKRQEAKELHSDLSIDQKTLALRHLAIAMMERRIRDVPADDAAAIVGPTLEKVSYQGSPAEFLVEIEQTTGLVIERDNGVYAFVHLTFQEYLAAVHLAEIKSIDFLVENLNDSWWREVTLLRVANADATPIVQAVLRMDPPTVELLSLAADCIDQAREVDASVKKTLVEALSWQSWEHDPARLRLAAEVMLGRKLQHVVRSKNSAIICAEPVANAEYHIFLQDLGQNAATFRPDTWATQPVPTDGLPVVGVSPQAATRFVEWVRLLGLDVRLPKENELADEDYRRVAKTPAARFWATGRDAHTTRKRPGSEQNRSEEIVLLPPTLSPEFPGIHSLLHRQLCLDATLVRHLIPTPNAANAALSPGSGPVYVSVLEYRKMMEALQPEVEGVAGRDALRTAEDAPRTTEEVDGEASIRSRGTARALVDYITALAADRLSVPLPSDAPERLVPESYRAQISALAEELAVQWKAGAHWEESAGIVGDPFLMELFSLAPGTEKTALLIRAYLHIVAWALMLDPDIFPRRRYLAFSTAYLPYYRRSRRSRDFAQQHRKHFLVVLARFYLVEWRIHGLLPRHEGLLLVRE
jgi:hypothetical protein